jgi:hypothetical protein
MLKSLIAVAALSLIVAGCDNEREYGHRFQAPHFKPIPMLRMEPAR